MKNLKYWLLLACLIALPLSAQNIQEDIENDNEDSVAVADSSIISVQKRDSLTLPWAESVRLTIERMLQSNMFATSQVGLMVWDLDADSAIVKYNERQTLRPASTMKVLTAITAIDRLGGDYQFKTELCYDGEVNGGVLNGDVYCVGGFDPRFNSDDMQAFIESIKKMGVDTIRGSLYADKSMKDTDRLGEGWCWDDDNPVLSPLLISRKDVFIDRFYQELTRNGIYVTGTTGEKRKPENSYCIVRRFHTIDQILMKMLKESDNLYAESMFYQIAASTGNHPASARSARAVENRLFSKIGLNPARYNVADGSGLSLYNYVSAELEVKMLRYAYNNNNIYLHLYPALPIAGVDGTLKKRMRGTSAADNVHAKTGTVTGISSLCGYCVASNGHHLCFSIINQGLMHRSNGRAFQDKVCALLCEP